jgi:hypothetical protein
MVCRVVVGRDEEEAAAQPASPNASAPQLSHFRQVITINERRPNLGIIEQFLIGHSLRIALQVASGT